METASVVRDQVYDTASSAAVENAFSSCSESEVLEPPRAFWSSITVLNDVSTRAGRAWPAALGPYSVLPSASTPRGPASARLTKTNAVRLLVYIASTVART